MSKHVQFARIFIVFALALASIFTGSLPDSKQIELTTPGFSSPNEQIIAQKELSLSNRQPNSWVNNIFKENILLNLAYLRGLYQSAPLKHPKIDWDIVTKPFTYEFRLEPKEVFAFHEDVESTMEGKIVKTTNAHFNSQEGFKSDGYLFGDGVCHLASLIYWAAKEANLEALAPTRHDFAKIEDVPREFGVSIYNNPLSKGSNVKQNLYITNNKSKPVVFRFDYKDDRVKVAVVETN